nr:class I SAM-dependent methyltransferase [Oceanococcus sp. HetDA_MAG_MS8]
MYSKITTQSGSWVKRHAHNTRFETALALATRYKGLEVLDYGAGDGHFAKRLLSKAPQVTAYEPLGHMHEQLRQNALDEISGGRIIAERQYSNLGVAKYDLIFCLEVLEHLPERILLRSLEELQSLLSPTGVLIISVPIETGVSGLLKNCIRKMLRKPHHGGTWPNILKSALNMPVGRFPGPANCSYIPSHIGFSHKSLRPKFEASGFSVIDTQFSPFPWFHGVLNSQVFFVLRHSPS